MTPNPRNTLSTFLIAFLALCSINKAIAQEPSFPQSSQTYTLENTKLKCTINLNQGKFVSDFVEVKTD